MKELLCFGDSNTYGLIPSGKGRYPREIRWTGLLEKELYKDGYRIIEEGLCGRTTVFQDEFRSNRQGCDLLPVLLESHKPVDLVILMLGTNDCKSHYHASAEEIGLGIEKLIEQIKRQDDETDILLISPIHLGDKIWQKQYDPEFSKESVETSKRLKNVYREIAQKHHIDFIAASDYAKPSDVDREHLDEIGHRKIARALLQKLKERELAY